MMEFNSGCWTPEPTPPITAHHQLILIEGLISSWKTSRNKMKICDLKEVTFWLGGGDKGYKHEKQIGAMVCWKL